MKTAFVFPGQGAQKVGMVKDLYDNYPVVKELFEEADDALHFSLTKLIFEGPDEELMKTSNTQPAILTASTACCRVLQQEGLTPDIAAGHSLGEYSALVAAGSLSFADAVRTVRLRGQFMQEAVPLGEGAMAAILGRDEEKVRAICAPCRHAPRQRSFPQHSYGTSSPSPGGSPRYDYHPGCADSRRGQCKRPDGNEGCRYQGSPGQAGCQPGPLDRLHAYDAAVRCRNLCRSRPWQDHLRLQPQN